MYRKEHISAIYSSSSWWITQRNELRNELMEQTTKLIGCFDCSNKVRKSSYYLSIVFKLLYGRKQSLDIVLYYLILVMYQYWDTCFLIRFISHFWSNINKQGVTIRMTWYAISKEKKWLRVGGATIPSGIECRLSLENFRMELGCCEPWQILD